MKNGTFDFRIEGFCQGCGNFVPEVAKYDCTLWESSQKVTSTIVTCEHIEDCRSKHK